MIFKNIYQLTRLSLLHVWVTVLSKTSYVPTCRQSRRCECCVLLQLFVIRGESAKTRCRAHARTVRTASRCVGRRLLQLTTSESSPSLFGPKAPGSKRVCRHQIWFHGTDWLIELAGACAGRPAAHAWFLPRVRMQNDRKKTTSTTQSDRRNVAQCCSG